MDSERALRERLIQAEERKRARAAAHDAARADLAERAERRKHGERFAPGSETRRLRYLAAAGLVMTIEDERRRRGG